MSKLKQAQEAIRDKDKIDEDDRVPTSKKEHTPAISTGSIMVDYVIGGTRTEDGLRQCPGFPRGMITELYGPESSGKTTLALGACAQAQKAGGSAAFIDFENAIALDWASKIGVNVRDEDKFALWQPNTMEAGLELVEAYVEAKVDLIIVDSIPAMTPEKELNAELTEMQAGGMGLKARMMSDMLSKLLNKLNSNDDDSSALVFINQTRSSINSWGATETTPGGNAKNFYAALRLRVEAQEQHMGERQNDLTGEVQKVPVETESEVATVKSKVSSHQGKKGPFYIRYSEGIDNLRTILKMAEHNGLIEVSGSWYYYQTPDGGEEKVQGQDNLRNEVAENDQLRQWMVERVLGSDGESGEDPEEDSDSGETDES